MNRPNIVYLHSHDTGRHIRPHGFAVDTPRLQRFAERGVTFRQAFCNNPTCSPSRACLLTGRYAHANGMMGLAHRGGKLTTPQRSLPAILRDAGYRTLLAGVQHVVPGDDAEALTQLGYTDLLLHRRRPTPQGDFAARDQATAEVAIRFLESLASNPQETDQGGSRASGFEGVDQGGSRASGFEGVDQGGSRASGAGSAAPFFLDVGHFATHRTPMPGKGKTDEQWHNGPLPPQGDPRYVRVPDPLPETPETRADFADFLASVARLDRLHGEVLDALDAAGLRANTLVFITTDHGLAFPHMKCNLTAHGTGVLLLMAGPDLPEGMVVDSLVSHVDILPTLCELTKVAAPPGLQGRSLLPALRNPLDPAAVCPCVFAEVNYHAAFEPMRSVRTATHSYIRRLIRGSARPAHAVLPNIDDSPSKTLVRAAGVLDEAPADEQLFDLLRDPGETCNRAGDPAYSDVLNDLRRRVDAWMRETQDPALAGLPRVAGMLTNDPHGQSPGDPASAER